MDRLPPLDDLHVFAVAARHRSFKLAAASLHVTPGAVSHRIRALEQMMGVPLFERLTRRVELTRAGHDLARAMEEALARIRAGVALIQPDAVAGPLTVSVLSSFAARWLLPRLSLFQTAWPEIILTVDADDRLNDMSGEGPHVGVRFGEGHYPGLSVTPIAGDRAFPVCSPQFLSLHPIRVLADLHHVTLLQDARACGDGSGVDWASWLSSASDQKSLRLDANTGPRFSHAHLVVQAALDGQGVGMARASLVRDALARGQLVRPFVHVVPSRFGYYLVCGHAQAAHPRICAFRDWLISAVDWL